MRINKLFSAWSFASSQWSGQSSGCPEGWGDFVLELMWMLVAVHGQGAKNSLLLLLLDFTAQRVNLSLNPPGNLWKCSSLLLHVKCLSST